MLFDGRLLEVQLQEALLPGASDRAAAQRFPWQSPAAGRFPALLGCRQGRGTGSASPLSWSNFPAHYRPVESGI